MPVLTVPTPGHGEQMMNAVVHARVLPTLVRARTSLQTSDVRWLVDFKHSDASRAESADLRSRCGAMGSNEGIASLLEGSGACNVLHGVQRL